MVSVPHEKFEEGINNIAVEIAKVNESILYFHITNFF